MSNEETRTFNLINAKGQVYTLNILESLRVVNLYGVSGLGMKITPTFQRIGNNYEVLKEEIDQAKINGIIFFHGKYKYQEYDRFALFCQEKPLIMYYRTEAGEFKRYGIITRLDKEEKNSAMKCIVDFTTTSLWYKEFGLTVSGTSIDIESDSKTESPCHITFKPSSAITALSWTHYVDDVSVLTGALSGISVSPSQTLHIRTDTNPYEIYRDTEATDYYSKSDFSTRRFILLRKGLNRITFNVSGTISIEGKILYETV